MEFFNYAYCSLLHKHNEIENINILINNEHKELTNKKQNFETNLDIYVKRIFSLKYNLLNLKHIIIKMILLQYNAKKEIQSNNNIINLINSDILNNQSIKLNIYYYNLNYTYDVNKYQFTNGLSVFIKKIKLSNIYCNNKLITKSNIDRIVDYILLHIDKLKSFLEVKIYKIQFCNKSSIKPLKRLLYFQYNYLLIHINNTTSNTYNDDVTQLLYTILQYDKLSIVHNNLKNFFKYRLSMLNTNKKLTNKLNQINKLNNNHKTNIIKIEKYIINKISNYKKLYKSLQVKKNNVNKLHNTYEKVMKKSMDVLIVLNNKLYDLQKYIDNIHKIDCPDDIKNKCIIINDESLLCCICLNNITFGAKVTCGHIYHIHCINLYIYSIINNNDLRIKIQCPMCRQYI